jgi:RHS repeat-associated protein
VDGLPGYAEPRLFGYTGHVSDRETGLTYMQQRYYDPVAGRFLSVDPVVTNASNGSFFNRYVYGNNNPYKFIDPDGRSAVTKFVKQTIRHDGNVIQAAIDVGGDLITVFSPASTPWDRVEAAISLVSPIDVSDVKAAKSMLEAAGISGGGRKGGLDTRALNTAIGDKITSRGGSVEGGFGGKESQFGTGRGSRFSDGSATDKSGNRFEVQTVDTKAGGSLTEREVSAARDIAQKSNGPVVCVSKDSCR